MWIRFLNQADMGQQLLKSSCFIDLRFLDGGNTVITGNHDHSQRHAAILVHDITYAPMTLKATYLLPRIAAESQWEVVTVHPSIPSPVPSNDFGAHPTDLHPSTQTQIIHISFQTGPRVWRHVGPHPTHTLLINSRVFSTSLPPDNSGLPLVIPWNSWGPANCRSFSESDGHILNVVGKRCVYTTHNNTLGVFDFTPNLSYLASSSDAFDDVTEARPSVMRHWTSFDKTVVTTLPYRRAERCAPFMMGWGQISFSGNHIISRVGTFLLTCSI